MNTDSAALLAHIQAENRKTVEWVAAGPNRFAITAVEDIAHWAESGVHTVEDFIKYGLACEIYDGSKYAYGFKPNWSGLMSCTVEELTAEVNRLRIECRRMAELEESERAYEKAEEEYASMQMSAYEDRYEDLAEAYGY